MRWRRKEWRPPTPYLLLQESWDLTMTTRPRFWETAEVVIRLNEIIRRKDVSADTSLVLLG